MVELTSRFYFASWFDVGVLVVGFGSSVRLLDRAPLAKVLTHIVKYTHVKSDASVGRT